jgi:molybdopterin molybdotransferase
MYSLPGMIYLFESSPFYRNEDRSFLNRISIFKLSNKKSKLYLSVFLTRSFNFRMISFEEALEIVENSAVLRGTERVGMMDSLNRVLAEDISSDIQMPPFDKSAVDGYACRRGDVFQVLEVIETIPAGKVPEKKIGANQCSKIMTGAPVPEGADTVIMLEDVVEVGSNQIRYTKEKVRNNICYQGEDIQPGQVLLKKGTLIQPQHISVLATAGAVMPLVSTPVQINIISTGDELVEPGQKPDLSQIRNSNAYQLKAQAIKTGAKADYLGIAADTESSTREILIKAFGNGDIILLTGGVSQGDFDYVPQVLTSLAVDIKFRSISVQPGRPTIFGIRNRQYIFGLPGNPVSSFVQFELLVKPLVYKISGFQYKPHNIMLRLGKEYIRKRSDRLSWLPAEINSDGELMPLEYHGSAHINALSAAHGLIAVPVGKAVLKKGELVSVRQI